MAIVYPIADTELVAKLNLRLEEFRKLRVGYIDTSSVSETIVKETKIEKKKVVKKKTLLQRFLFSDYE